MARCSAISPESICVEFITLGFIRFQTPLVVPDSPMKRAIAAGFALFPVGIALIDFIAM